MPERKKNIKIYYNKHADSYEFGKDASSYEFSRDHLVELPIKIKAKNEKDEKILARIYQKMNMARTNPLATTSEEETLGQEWLKKNMKNPHTSMSIGDAVEIDGKLYAVDIEGFTEVETL